MAVSGATAGNLGDFVDCFSGGTPLKDALQFWNGPIPWVTPKDMKALVLAGTADTLTARGVTAGSRLAPRGASFIVVRGMILAHSFPVSILPDRAAFNQDVKALVARSGLQQDYLTFWLVAHCDEMLRRVGESTHGTKKLDLRDLKALPMVVPPIGYQTGMVTGLWDLEARIDAEARLLGKLEQQKKGLLLDLLSGRVRMSGATA